MTNLRRQRALYICLTSKAGDTFLGFGIFTPHVSDGSTDEANASNTYLELIVFFFRQSHHQAVIVRCLKHEIICLRRTVY